MDRPGRTPAYVHAATARAAGDARGVYDRVPLLLLYGVVPPRSRPRLARPVMTLQPVVAVKVCS